MTSHVVSVLLVKPVTSCEKEQTALLFFTTGLHHTAKHSVMAVWFSGFIII
jgi:hypothetical protein